MSVIAIMIMMTTTTTTKTGLEELVLKSGVHNSHWFLDERYPLPDKTNRVDVIGI